MSIAVAYLRFELVRTLRNRRAVIFALIFPVLLYLFIAGPNRHQEAGDTGISVPLYFMVSIASFGTMTAMLSGGARIAVERASGWNRQLRITPLDARTYFRVKVLTSYAVALLSILVLDAAGLSLGVSVPIGRWLEMTGLVLIGLLPFAALGIWMGHVIPADSTGPAMGGITSILALISGTWFPIGSSGFVHDVAVALPSYYLVQAGRIAIGGQAWGAAGWAVIALWTLAFGVLARRAYLRDTGRA